LTGPVGAIAFGMPALEPSADATPASHTCSQQARDWLGNEHKGLDLEIAYSRLVRDDRAFSIYVF
ncbi:MAG: hypothetical protein WBZ22_08925, partial [Pseudolabrys sp.]